MNQNSEVIRGKFFAPGYNNQQCPRIKKDKQLQHRTGKMVDQGRKGFPRVHRYITTHNHDGEAVFLSSCQVPECAPFRTAGEDGELALLYSTDTFPVQCQDELDVAVYDSSLHMPPGITPENGTVFRVIDMQPLKESPMHRTVTVDYSVVLEGEVDLVLDSGEKRTLRQGDVTIQRGTAHSFRNRSTSSWCRLLFVFMPMQQLTIGGKKMEEEWYDERYETKDEQDMKEQLGYHD
jgi:quercetin dioxygenase-like cupin family protein